MHVYASWSWGIHMVTPALSAAVLRLHLISQLLKKASMPASVHALQNYRPDSMLSPMVRPRPTQCEVFA